LAATVGAVHVPRLGSVEFSSEKLIPNFPAVPCDCARASFSPLTISRPIEASIPVSGALA
jgi:hypothetical protein